MQCALAETLGIKSAFKPEYRSTLLVPLSTNGVGVDGVLITASTHSSDPVHLAAQLCRKRRIISVGLTGLNLRRDFFYKKELAFQVSCSYGPGRYDPAYERRGKTLLHWLRSLDRAAQSQAVLHTLASGLLVTEPLITHRFHWLGCRCL